MSQLTRSPALAGSADASPAASTRLHGPWLLLARVGLVAVAGPDLVFFVASMPAFFVDIATGCRTVGCDTRQVAVAALLRLHTLGMSFNTLAWLYLGLNGLMVCVFVMVGLLLLWRRADDRVALLAVFTFLTFPITLSNVTNTLPTPWWLPAHILNGISGLGLYLMLLVFPSGRFVPRWTGWIWAGTAIVQIVQFGLPFSPFYFLLSNARFVVVALSVIMAQSYRYWHVSTLVERQQTKLVVFGVSIAFVGGLAVGLASPLLATGSIPLPINVAEPLSVGVFGILFLSPNLIPVTFGVAILRYRLWDVDVLVNRVLVYGLLTGLLGTLYVGLVIGLESLAGRFVGPAASNPPILVASTLLIAALVRPLLTRLQRLADRHFYRQQYDATRTLAAFSAKLRNEVELSRLQAELLAVVNATMRPAHLSLWLRPMERYSPHQVARPHQQQQQQISSEPHQEGAQH